MNSTFIDVVKDLKTQGVILVGYYWGRICEGGHEKQFKYTIDKQEQTIAFLSSLVVWKWQVTQTIQALGARRIAEKGSYRLTLITAGRAPPSSTSVGGDENKSEIAQSNGQPILRIIGDENGSLYNI
ncbi:hypothetical protein Tco_1390134 [Tanacetum coccineum]